METGGNLTSVELYKSRRGGGFQEVRVKSGPNTAEDLMKIKAEMFTLDFVTMRSLVSLELLGKTDGNM